MLQFPLAFEARVERLLVLVIAVTMALQKAPTLLLGQHIRVVAMSRDAHGLDQPLPSEMAQVAGARIGRPIVVVPEVTTGDNPKCTDRRERA